MKKGKKRILSMVLTMVTAFAMAFGCVDIALAAGEGGANQGLSVNDVQIYTADSICENTLTEPIDYRGGAISLKVVTGGLINQWGTMEKYVTGEQSSYEKDGQITVVNGVSQIVLQTESGEAAGTVSYGGYVQDASQPYYVIELQSASGDFVPGEYKIIFPDSYPVKGEGKPNWLTTDVATLHFSIAVNPVSITGYGVTAASSVYNGKAQRPAVRVNGLQTSAYTVSWPTAVKAGVYTAKVSGKQPYYTGTKNVSFRVNPATGKIKKLKAGKKKFTVYVANQKASGITGYQILYKKAGDKKWKSTTLSASKTSKAIKKLKKKKKYTVKVRGYKKTGSGTIYGNYSPAKTIKVK